MQTASGTHQVRLIPLEGFGRLEQLKLPNLILGVPRAPEINLGARSGGTALHINGRVAFRLQNPGEDAVSSGI